MRGRERVVTEGGRTRKSLHSLSLLGKQTSWWKKVKARFFFCYSIFCFVLEGGKLIVRVRACVCLCWVGIEYKLGGG